MAGRIGVTIVGPGRLGSALALELKRAGYPVREIVSRTGRISVQRARSLARKVGAKAIELGTPFAGQLVWLCVPDAAIASIGRTLAKSGPWAGKIVLHPSGALGSAELTALRHAGASVASAHPLMTFVSNSKPSFKGVPFAFEGDPRAVRVARQMIRDLGAQAFTVDARSKSAYHAWSTFSSPLLIALLVTAEQVARIAGVPPRAARRRMLPILEQTLENYSVLGPAAAFSGPLIRGDAQTVAAHLRALQSSPAAHKAYIALAESALKHLPVKNREQIARLLKRA